MKSNFKHTSKSIVNSEKMGRLYILDFFSVFFFFFLVFWLAEYHSDLSQNIQISSLGHACI